MPQVNVTINGRQFRMACEEGEEMRLARLAEDLDQRITRLRGRFGEIGDTRLTVMAALTVADELAETREKLAAAQSELTGLRGTDAATSERNKISQAAAAAALNTAAERIEALVKRLNQTLGDRAVPMG
jgi:cell division protein ZapA